MQTILKRLYPTKTWESEVCSHYTFLFCIFNRYNWYHVLSVRITSNELPPMILKRIEYILEWNLDNPLVWILSVPFSLKGSSKCTYHVNVHKLYGVEYISTVCSQDQGTNVRKVISEVYTFFILQCTVFGRKSKHKTDVTAWHGIHFHKNNLWNILVKKNYYVNYQNFQNSMLKCIP